MINSTDVSDLQLEDVEDYSADYPPAGFPKAEENIAAVGTDPNEFAAKKHRSYCLEVLRSNKWTSGVMLVVAIVLIVVVSTTAGGNSSTPTPSNGDSGPVDVDPDSLDPTVVADLKNKILTVYSNNGLDASALDDDAGDTPQRKAFHWLASTKNLNSQDHTQKAQRYALATFYYATNNVENDRTKEEDMDVTPWLHAHNWLTHANACEWKGINCNDQEHIESIDLEENNLTGHLPPELAIFGDQLKHLTLTSNYIHVVGSDFDVFEKLDRLETCLFDDNFLEYDQGLPPQFGKLTDMRKLRLSYNLFSGELEKNNQVLSKMTKLTHLELEYNHIEGSIPDVIGELTDLVYIYMRGNDMRYNLDWLKAGKLTDLFALWLDRNEITGTIPTEVGLLTGLASLSLTNATLTGPIPTELGDLPGLRRLWLFKNELTGDVPQSLRKPSELEVLELHDNMLVGNMPSGVCDNIQQSDYVYKSLTCDCEEVSCAEGTCCTQCF